MNNKIKAIIKWINRVTGCILWSILIFSTVIELKNGGSIYHNILNGNYNFPILFNSNSILKVAESIGISSILIVWLYSSFDKVEIGFKYITILESKCRFFYFYTLSHFASILICIWAASSNTLEIAVISLIIIIWGSITHCAFIGNLLLNSNNRRKFSMQLWGEKISKIKDIDSCSKTFAMLTDVFPINDVSDAENFSCLFMDLMNKTEEISKGCNKTELISCYFSIWKNLFDKYTIYDQKLIIKYISSNTTGVIENSQSQYSLIAYIIWLYNKTKINCESDGQPLINTIHQFIGQLSIGESIKNNLYLYYYALIWFLFLNKQINLNCYFIKHLSIFYQNNTYEKETFEEYIIDLAKYLKITNNKYFNICSSQILK